MSAKTGTSRIQARLTGTHCHQSLDRQLTSSSAPNRKRKRTKVGKVSHFTNIRSLPYSLPAVPPHELQVGNSMVDPDAPGRTHGGLHEVADGFAGDVGRERPDRHSLARGFRNGRAIIGRNQRSLTMAGRRRSSGRVVRVLPADVSRWKRLPQCDGGRGDRCAARRRAISCTIIFFHH